MEGIDILKEPDFSFNEEQREALIERAKETVEREMRDDFRWAGFLTRLQSGQPAKITIEIKLPK